MALQSAQLVSAIAANQITFSLTGLSAAGQAMLPAVGSVPLSYGIPMQIDNEFCYVISQPVLGTVTVRGRGTETVAAPHDTLANVYFSSLPGDFPVPQPGQLATQDDNTDNTISLGQDTTVTVPNVNVVYNINKLTAAAITLNPPSLTSNGVLASFVSNTAAAHVITATGLLEDGVTGSPHTTATFAAFKGATATFVAENGLWTVHALQAVTIS